MENTKDMCGMCGTKGGESCMCGCGHRRHTHFTRLFLMVVLFVIVFCFGVNIGELKGEIRASYRSEGRSMMYGSQMHNRNDLYPPMMVPATQTIPQSVQ